MSDTQWVIIAVVLIVLIVAVLFRGKISLNWKILGSELKLEGEKTPAADKSDAAAEASREKVTASGAGSVAAGRDISGSTIVTGDNSGKSLDATAKNNS